jgi:hypothetical protein
VRLGATLALVLISACAGAALPSAASDAPDGHEFGPWIELFDGQALGPLEPTAFGGQGQVRVQGGALILPFGSPLTGVTYSGVFPTSDYELECRAARLSGTDFFCALTFPVHEQHATLVLGGWGGALTGLSCVDGEDASSNGTRRFVHFEAGRDYLVRVQLGRGRLRCFLDGELIVDLETAAHVFSLRPEVELNRPLGLATYLTTGRIRVLRYRRITSAPG